MYADVEALVVAYLGPLPGIHGVAVELPQDVLDKLPFVLVGRVSGGDNYITDSAVVDIDTFHITRVQALAVARTVHAAMMRLRHTAVNGVLIDSVETVTGPMWVDYDDENLRRYVATYLVESRVSAAP